MIPRVSALILSALAAASGQCLPVSGDRILAGDIARAVPAFAAIAPQIVLGSAPPLGARRNYPAEELARLARRYGLAVEPGRDACFVRPPETLTFARVAAALHAIMPTARIEVIDFSHQPIPHGELLFSLSGAGDQQIWHGVISAPGQADFPVWARARVVVSGKRVVAVESLAAGRPIARAQLREEPYVGAPGRPDLAEVENFIPRRPIAAGTVIESQWLDRPVDVLRGELVRIEVRSGAARVLAIGAAEASGRRGDVIPVRVSDHGKIIHAGIIDRSTVAISANGEPLRFAEEGTR